MCVCAGTISTFFRLKGCVRICVLSKYLVVTILRPIEISSEPWKYCKYLVFNSFSFVSCQRWFLFPVRLAAMRLVCSFWFGYESRYQCFICFAVVLLWSCTAYIKSTSGFMMIFYYIFVCRKDAWCSCGREIRLYDKKGSEKIKWVRKSEKLKTTGEEEREREITSTRQQMS